MMQRIREVLRSRDEGSALVAAVGVAIIGAILTGVVVAQAVIVQQDSGIDRARTVQVHGAEGAVDHIYGLLEMQTPCQWPATGTQVVSSAVHETSVAATIEYFDENDAPISCANDVLSRAPASAVITATASSGELPGARSDLARTVQAKVLLKPLTEPGAGAAIFSSYAHGGMTNNFTLHNDDPDNDADIWIDSGDVDCNSNVLVRGRLFVPDGGLATSNGCTLEQDVRVRNYLRMNQGRILGDAYVYRGNATINGTQGRVEGNLTASGTITNSAGGVPNVGGTVMPGWSPGSDIVRVPLPEVNKNFSDWSGFSTGLSFEQWLHDEAVRNGAPTWSPFRSGDPCDVAISSPQWSIGGNIESPGGKTIIDATQCPNGFRMQNVTLTLRGDLVIFAKSFNLTNTVNVVSDGNGPHKIWLIVPDVTPNGVANCTSNQTGDIQINSHVTFHGPDVETFLYTPCTAEISNYVKLHGQIYGSKVSMRNNLEVTFRGIGVPGVDLFPDMPIEGSGYEVAVVYKREIGAVGNVLIP